MNHLQGFGGSSHYNPLSVPYNYKYNQKELQETGMYDYGWRMYMPDIARWNGMDQLAESYNPYSPYAYVMNNPVMFTDPDGRKIEETSDGWNFTGYDINLIFSYFSNGGDYGNLTGQLTKFGDFGGGAISNFWNTFNSGGVMGGVRVQKGYLSYWTDGAAAYGNSMQELAGHRFKIKQDEFNDFMGKKDREKELLKNLHTGFDAVEELGGWMEIAGVVFMPFTEGASAELTAVGSKISAIGLIGNVLLDLYEENYDMAIFRGVKYGVSWGAGKAIDRLAPGVLDNIILKSKFFIYEKLVSPGIQQNYVPGMPPQP